MFSVNLPADSKTSALDALREALSHVAEDSFYASVEPIDEGWRDAAPGDAAWLDAIVSFRGAGAGSVRCRLPRELAVEFACAFLGASPEEIEPRQIVDLAGELTNMICGCWLTRAFPHQLFRLDRPSVVEAAGAPPDDWLVSAVSGQPLGVSVTFAEAA